MLYTVQAAFLFLAIVAISVGVAVMLVPKR
jgi:hypothetical protein